MWCEPHTYQALEIDKILRILAAGCRSPLGQETLHKLTPAGDGTALARRVGRFRAYLQARDRQGEYPWDGRLRPLSPLAEEARRAGWLTGEELVTVRIALLLAKRLRQRLRTDGETWPELKDLARTFHDWDEEVAALEMLDEDGRFYDHASPELKRIRQKQFTVRDAIKRRSQQLFQDSGTASMLQERVLSLRNGRFCVLVRMDAAGGYPGLVLEKSSSGNSIYVEPQILLPLNNQWAVLLEEEREEESRLLRALTGLILKREKALLDTEESLGLLDLYYALGERMDRDRWTLPEWTPKKTLDFRQARHPLLGDRAVPLDLLCGEGYRMLVITGPNTGGKTVALKTLGVCAYLAWMGFPVPCREDSRVGEVGELFADIGDEQSIEQNLSTFSAHVHHLVAILKSATERSLVLLDELGAGTDPDEGSALGIALLEHFRKLGCLLWATTHHNPIKHFALATSGVETASMEFDLSTLSPTYRLRLGIPGKSNALLIARKLGMPGGVLRRAREAMEGQHADFEALLGELEEKRRRLEREMETLEAKTREAERLRRDFETRNKEIQEKKDKLLEQADHKASRIIREAEEGAKALLRNLREAELAKAHQEYQRKKHHFDRLEDRREEREIRRVNRLAAEGSTGEPQVGDRVEIPGSGLRGDLVALEGGDALVQSGPMRVRVPLKRLKRSADQQRNDPPPRIQVSAPRGVSSSLMVRGMTVDEAMPLVEQYLDQAYRAGYGEVSVIHGRGEGILRREVQELCKRTPFVESHRLGGPGEGGYGVTIVRFAS